MRIAVFTGGESSEREVAFWSAKNVVAELERVGFEVEQFDVPSELPKFIETKDRFSCVVPVLHGKGGEDGTIQGFLETLKMPYLFSGVAASAVAMDKAVAKAVVSVQGVKTPEARVITQEDEYVFAGPVVVKPIPCGSTLGVSIVKRAEDLNTALKLGFEHGDRLLAETYVDGAEYTVPVVEDGGVTRALEVIEIDVSGNLFSFDEKYAEGNEAIEICPARIDANLKKRLQSAAVTAHEIIGARHFTRADFMVDVTGEIWFLETNTIPGMTAHSLTNKALAVENKTFGELLKQWIDSVI